MPAQELKIEWTTPDFNLPVVELSTVGCNCTFRIDGRVHLKLSQPGRDSTIEAVDLERGTLELYDAKLHVASLSCVLKVDAAPGPRTPWDPTGKFLKNDVSGEWEPAPGYVPSCPVLDNPPQ